MKNNFKHIIGLISGLCFFLCASNVSAQLSATELDRIFASDAASGDGYGYDVDVDGDRAVIGSRLDDDDGGGSGAAYVYLKDPKTNKWTEEAKLVMAGAAAGDNFGSSVAIDGDVIVVGAPQDDINVGSNFHGSAHVFTRGPGGWDAGIELLPQDNDIEYQNYGISVDIDNGTIVVGVAFDSDMGAASGSAYVYELAAGVWQRAGKLLPPTTENNQNFGWSVAIDMDTIVIGAPHWTDPKAGSAYAFTRSDSWVNPTSSKLPVTDNLTGDQFGWSVAVSGNIAVVGANMDDDAVNGNDSGSITVFDNSSGDWINEDKLLASNGEQNDRFGSDVATNGEAVIAGAFQNGSFNRGSFYTFSNPGSGWAEDGVIWPTSSSQDVSNVQQFGTSVALDGGMLIVGAPASDINNGSTFVFVTGAAFVYGLNATSIPTADGSDYLVIQSPPGTFLTDVSAVDPVTLGAPPPGVSFPLGALSFNVEGITPGAAVEVEILFPKDISVSSYFKYSDQWYEFFDNGTTGATVTPGIVTLKLVDGDRGDHDLVADGVITDPGALSAIIISDTLFEDGFED